MGIFSLPMSKDPVLTIFKLFEHTQSMISNLSIPNKNIVLLETSKKSLASVTFSS